MQTFILIVSFGISLIIIEFCIYRHKIKELEEQEKDMIKEFEEQEKLLDKKFQEMEKILDLLSEDTKILKNDIEFQKWREEIKEIATESIYEMTFGEKTNNLYCVLKRYEDWRKKKLR